MSVLVIEPSVDEIVSHMETDKISIAPYAGGYIIAESSNEAKKLTRLQEDAKRLPKPHNHYYFITVENWKKVNF